MAARHRREADAAVKKIVIFNGSPRMDGNTVTLLNLIAKGARDAGRRGEVLHALQDEVHGLPELLRLPHEDRLRHQGRTDRRAAEGQDGRRRGGRVSHLHMQMTGPVKNLYDRLFPLTDIDVAGRGLAPRRW